MSMRSSFLTDKVLSQRVGLQHLTVACHVTIRVYDWGDNPQTDLSCLRPAVERAMALSIANIPDGLSVRFRVVSLGLTTPLIYPPTPHQVSFRTHVLMRASERFLSFAQTQGKQSMLVLANRIDLQGFTVTISRTLELTYCVWNLFSGEGWREPPPNSTRTHQAARDISAHLETLSDWGIEIGSPESKQMNE